MKVLFVDDEDRVLEGIQRSLFSVEDWEIDCATSGTAALELMQDETFDVVVTDMRMPGMDGAELLKRVHKEHPNVVRIVLSGHAEVDAIMRTVGVAHKFLTKPCGPGTLQRTIQSTVELQQLLGRKQVRDIVGRVPVLPVAPDIYVQLTALLASPDTEASEITRLIKRDPAISAKLLQVVNSSFFAHSQPTSEIHDAIVRLGFETVKQLVLSLSVMGRIKLKKPIRGFSLTKERTHAAKTAQIATALYQSSSDKADAFTASLLHDLGKLVLAAEAPEILTEALERAHKEGLPLHEAENRLYEATHADLGAYLLGLWNLPHRVVESIAYHHRPDDVACSSSLSLCHALHIANSAAHGDFLDDEILKRYGSPLSSNEIRKLAAQPTPMN